MKGAVNCGVHCEMQTFVNNWMSECVPACGIGLGQGCFMVRMHASAAYMFNFAAVLVWWQMTCLSNTWHAELHCFFLQTVQHNWACACQLYSDFEYLLNLSI